MNHNNKSINELVSVIIPVYNERQYLQKCIFSICNQTIKNLEIILVDDGSTDGTSTDCDEIAKTDKRIKVIHKSNEGLSAARITGLKAAKGTWITFVDDDDVISRFLIEALLSFKEQKDVDIIAGGRLDTEDIESAIPIVEAINIPPIKSLVDTGINICNRIPYDNPNILITPLWGKLYRKQFLDSLPLEKYKTVCPTIFFEDIFVTPLLYCKARKICIVQYPLYLHREVPTSISRSGKLSSFYYEQIDSGDMLLNYYKKNNMTCMYSYEITKYIRNCLRIWCLIDDQDKRKYELGLKIKHQYKKYFRDYLKFAKTSLGEKIAFFLYGISINGWRIMARLFYRIRGRKVRRTQFDR